MRAGATDDQISAICSRLDEAGLGQHLSRGEVRCVIGVIGAGDRHRQTLADQLETMPGVDRVVLVLKPYKLVSAEGRASRSIVKVGEAFFGGTGLVVAAGPCSVESRDQLLTAARAVRECGAQVLRGGAFKPRTSPYDFQGLGHEGLDFLVEAREATGMPIVTEACAVKEVDLVAEHADIVQIGARNMQNYDLLQAAGKTAKPVLLKRGLSATIDEWLKAAEYVAATGNTDIIFCERGIRTFETETRFTLDIAAVPVLKRLTHLPVIVDPSHASGRRELVTPLALAAVAAGADGLIVEVHPNPERALSDGAQALTPPMFASLMRDLQPVAESVGRSVAGMAGRELPGASWEP